MYMEESPDTTKVKEPRAMLAVLIFSMIFMVGFGIWHAPILDFSTNSVPNLSQLTAVLPSFPTR